MATAKTYLCFTLSMPRRGSWNGGWSGAERYYAIVQAFKAATAEKILAGGPYGYHWSDGWGANVTVTETTGAGARGIRKKSNGFCGYEWMIESIVRHGKILDSQQEAALRLKEQVAHA